MIDLTQFQLLARQRRAVRSFTAQSIENDLLKEILDTARWAPSAYNLQPTHFFVVSTPEIKQKIYSACMQQKQILQAPALIIFTGDRDVSKNHLDKVLAQELKQNSISKEYAATLQKYVHLAFDHGPFKMHWLWKTFLVPIARLFRPIPLLPAVHKKYWVGKQVMLTAMNFMLAATAAGLSTVPMEGFDEGKLKKLLRIPKSHIIPIIIAVGYSEQNDLTKTRLPLEDILHRID